MEVCVSVGTKCVRSYSITASQHERPNIQALFALDVPYLYTDVTEFGHR
jgi:hypothetical protein